MRMGKRAVSQTVAAMMMLALTVSGFIILYAYAVGLFGSLQGGGPQQPFVDNIALEYFDWTDKTGVLKMQIRNVGSSNIIIKDVFIAGNLTTGITWGTAPNTCPSGNLPVQAACLVQLPCPSGLTNGMAYSVVFVTSSGAQMSFRVTKGQLS